MKQRICQVVLIDGPRGSGKSTIAKAVVERLNIDGIEARYFKKGPRDEWDEGKNMYRHLFDFLDREWVTVVDRFLLTEWVMSVVTRRVNSVELFDYCQQVNQYILDSGTLHYMIHAEVATLKRRIEERNTRVWDVHPEVVTPIWYAACGIFDGVEVLPNNTTEIALLHSVVKSIVSDVKRKVHNHAKENNANTKNI